jgi:hypothetical protein
MTDCGFEFFYVGTRFLFKTLKALLRIRIRGIHMFLGLPDPNSDPLVRYTDQDPAPDPDPFVIKQK